MKQFIPVQQLPSFLRPDLHNIESLFKLPQGQGKTLLPGFNPVPDDHLAGKIVKGKLQGFIGRFFKMHMDSFPGRIGIYADRGRPFLQIRDRYRAEFRYGGCLQDLARYLILQVYHDGKAVYRGLPRPFKAGRYHSLVIERESLPPELELSARTSDGVIMGVRHKRYPVEGIQFHPESIMTDVGHQVLVNFLNGKNTGWVKDS